LQLRRRDAVSRQGSAVRLLREGVDGVTRITGFQPVTAVRKEKRHGLETRDTWSLPSRDATPMMRRFHAPPPQRAHLSPGRARRLRRHLAAGGGAGAAVSTEPRALRNARVEGAARR